MDDGVLSTYFTQWMDVPDSILGDLAKRFLMRKPLKSATFTNEKRAQSNDCLFKELIEKLVSTLNIILPLIQAMIYLTIFIVQIKTVIVHKLN